MMKIFEAIINNEKEETKLEIQQRGYFICECIVASRIYREALPKYSSELEVFVAKTLDAINHINWKFKFNRNTLSKILFYPSVKAAIGIEANQKGYYNFSSIKTPILASLITVDRLSEIEKTYHRLAPLALEVLIPPKHLDLDDWIKLVDKIW